MKSIFKYVTCCRGAPAGDEEEASRKEETEIIVVPSPLRETKRQKSRRYRGTAKPAFADQNRKYSRLQWQPALSAISENKVATERELVSVVGGPEKIILQPKLERSNTSNKKAAASSKVYASNYGDNSWREGPPLMLPSLSPTIFAF